MYRWGVVGGMRTLGVLAEGVIGGIQKPSDDTETEEINESEAHTSVVIHRLISDDISLILVLLVTTLIVVMAWILCPFRSVCDCQPPRDGLEDPLMHDRMETAKQAIRRKTYAHSLSLAENL